MNTGFLESSPGNRSNSRLIATGVIAIALLYAGVILIYGMFNPTTPLLTIGSAVAAVFAGIAGPAMTFLFFVKQTESKEKTNEKIIKNTTDSSSSSLTVSDPGPVVSKPES